MTDGKVCSKCGERKPFADFHKNGDSLRPDCKACVRRRMREKWHEDPEVSRARRMASYYRHHEANLARKRVAGAKYREQNRDAIREKGRAYYRTDEAEAVRLTARLRHRFGMTLEDYERLWEEQGGRCAICGTHEDDLKVKFAVDHDHTTGKIRGLLCGPCNRSLGYFGDDLEGIGRVVSYLERHEDDPDRIPGKARNRRRSAA